MRGFAGGLLSLVLFSQSALAQVIPPELLRDESEVPTTVATGSESSAFRPRAAVTPVEANATSPLPPVADYTPSNTVENRWYCPDCCNSCGSNGDRLFGLFAHSDQEFCEFISPQSNPLFFEDPRTLSEIRFHFVNQWIPGSNVLLQGGEARMVAAQVRVALTERLSIIANKDGYLWVEPDNQLLPSQDGWADVAAGLKYNLIRDPEAKRILSAGFTFEFDNGSHKVFQGFGDGEFHPFVSGGIEFFERAHFLSGTGFRLPTDTVDRSQMWYWSNHLDYRLTDKLYSVVELNWFHWLQSGQRLPGINFEGGDVFNLGSGDVAGNDIVTLALGGRFNIIDNTEFGVAYEIPITQRKDLLQSRLYVDFIVRF